MSYCVYIMSSKSGVLYIGATNDLDRRVFEHKKGLIEGFTRKYKVTRLVYVEEFERAAEMAARERQLKGWTRRKKLELIHRQNPAMVDYARRTARGPSTPAAFAQDDKKCPDPLAPLRSIYGTKTLTASGDKLVAKERDRY
jgi:putative endonuclease